MSRILRRLYSRASAPSATQIASQFLTKSHSAPPLTSTQYLDTNQLSRFKAVLNSPLALAAEDGTPVAPCYHLAYFTPCEVESELGNDGSDRSYNPDAPFTRRMWAGGELKWSEKGNLLRAGQMVKETTTVLSAEAKRTKAGEEMVVVGLEKTFENEDGVAVVDKRNWIFRPAITTPLPTPPRPTEVAFPEAKYQRDFTQTPVMLFRFSALTFNGHKIHYNREWCREVEGHRDLVVHGPLNLINMVNLWRDVYFGGKEDVVPKSVIYRATHPLYVGERYRVLMEEEKENVSECRIVDSYGNVCMKGRIERF